MIMHILDCAKKTEIFDTIHVATDDAEVREIVSAAGFPPEFERSSDWSDDHSPLIPVLQEAIYQHKKCGKEFDAVCLLMACSPLVLPKDLQEAADIFSSHRGLKAVLSVTPFPAPIEWAFSQNKDHSLSPVKNNKMGIRSQDIEEHYYHTGNYVIFPTQQILDCTGPGTYHNFVGHILPKHRSVDIDTEDDWRIAEALFQHMKLIS